MNIKDLAAYIYQRKELGYRLIWSTELDQPISKGYVICHDELGNRITKDGGCGVTLYLMEILSKNYASLQNKEAQESINHEIELGFFHYSVHDRFIHQRFKDLIDVLNLKLANHEDVEFVLLVERLLSKAIVGNLPIYEWRPMEQAPYNGEPILACCVYGDKQPAGQQVIRWHEPWNEWTYADCTMHLYNSGDESDDMFPVCWMPLPHCFWEIKPDFKDAFIKKAPPVLTGTDNLCDTDLSEKSINRVIDSINGTVKESSPCLFEVRDCGVTSQMLCTKVAINCIALRIISLTA